MRESWVKQLKCFLISVDFNIYIEDYKVVIFGRLEEIEC